MHCINCVYYSPVYDGMGRCTFYGPDFEIKPYSDACEHFAEISAFKNILGGG